MAKGLSHLLKPLWYGATFVFLILTTDCGRTNQQSASASLEALQKSEQVIIRSENWENGIQLLEEWQQNSGYNDDVAERLNLYRKLAIEKYYKKAQLLVSKGEFEEAYTELSKIYDLDPENIKIRRLLAYVLLKQERFEQALTILDWLHKQTIFPGLPPTTPEIFLLLDKAYALRRINRLQEAENVRQLAISAMTTFLEAEDNQITILLQKDLQGQLEKEKHLLKVKHYLTERNRLVKKFESLCPLVTFEKGQFSQELELLNEQLDTLWTTKSTAPSKSIDPVTASKDSLESTGTSRTSSAGAKGALSGMYRPDEWDTLPAQLRQQIKNVEKEFKESNNQALDSPELLYKCGVILFQERHFKTALRYFNKVTTHDCAHDQLDCYFIELAASYIPLTLAKLSRYEQAISAELNYQKRYPNGSFVQSSRKSIISLAEKLGEHLNNQGKVHESLALFKRLAQYDTGRLTYLGAIMAHQAGLREAKKWLKKYIKKFPDGQWVAECQDLLDKSK